MNFQIYQSDVLGKMQRFQSHINKQVDLYTIYNTEAYYKIHVWCVDPDYRDKGQYIIVNSELICTHTLQRDYWFKTNSWVLTKLVFICQ